MTPSSEHKVPLLSTPEFVAHERRGGHASWLFLSLYLLLFALFVVLNSFSSFDSNKKTAVVSSVLDAFSQAVGPRDENGLTGVIGTEDQILRFQDAVTDIFETAIPLDNIRTILAGSRMDVDVPAQVFFADDSVVVRDPLPMLDRIVATVSSPPEGIAYELAIIAYVPIEFEDALPTEMTSSIARVGNIARALNAKGMPPRAASIGMERGTSQALKLVFFAIEENSSSSTSLALWDGGAG